VEAQEALAATAAEETQGEKPHSLPVSQLALETGAPGGVAAQQPSAVAVTTAPTTSVGSETYLRRLDMVPSVILPERIDNLDYINVKKDGVETKVQLHVLKNAFELKKFEYLTMDNSTSGSQARTMLKKVKRLHVTYQRGIDDLLHRRKAAEGETLSDLCQDLEDLTRGTRRSSPPSLAAKSIALSGSGGSHHSSMPILEASTTAATDDQAVASTSAGPPPPTTRTPTPPPEEMDTSTPSPALHSEAENSSLRAADAEGSPNSFQSVKRGKQFEFQVPRPRVSLAEEIRGNKFSTVLQVHLEVQFAIDAQSRQTYVQRENSRRARNLAKSEHDEDCKIIRETHALTCRQVELQNRKALWENPLAKLVPVPLTPEEPIFIEPEIEVAPPAYPPTEDILVSPIGEDPDAKWPKETARDGLNFIRPVMDETVRTYVRQILTRDIVLDTNKCSSCGNASHGDDDICHVEEHCRQKDFNSKRLFCDYELCATRATHVTKCCKTLHTRCAKCSLRGHNYSARAPVCQYIRTLWTLFEEHADEGLATKYRGFHPALGFWPARTPFAIRAMETLTFDVLQLASQSSINEAPGIITVCNYLADCDNVSDNLFSETCEMLVKATHEKELFDMRYYTVIKQRVKDYNSQVSQSILKKAYSQPPESFRSIVNITRPKFSPKPSTSVKSMNANPLVTPTILIGNVEVLAEWDQLVSLKEKRKVRSEVTFYDFERNPQLISFIPKEDEKLVDRRFVPTPIGAHSGEEFINRLNYQIQWLDEQRRVHGAHSPMRQGGSSQWPTLPPPSAPYRQSTGSTSSASSTKSPRSGTPRQGTGQQPRPSTTAHGNSTTGPSNPAAVKFVGRIPKVKNPKQQSRQKPVPAAPASPKKSDRSRSRDRTRDRGRSSNRGASKKSGGRGGRSDSSTSTKRSRKN
jgi:hypothetical protein